MVTSSPSRHALIALCLLLAVIGSPLSAQKPSPPIPTEPATRTSPPKSRDSIPSRSRDSIPAKGEAGSAVLVQTTARTGDPHRGRYRVVLNGFTAYRQTFDHPLQIDGKGDEVYFATYVARFDTTSPSLVDHEVITSKVHGDVNGFPERKQVGLASGRGGIKSGDSYPFPAPFKRIGEVSRDELPMLLWEGELTQGTSAVLIVPTVWEWDDNPELYAYWVVGRGAFIERLLEPATLFSILNNRTWLPVELAAPGLRIPTDGIGDARDRPIGLDTGNPATGAAFAEAAPNDKAAVPVAPAGGLSLAVQQILGFLSPTVGRSFEPTFRKVMESKRNAKGSINGALSLPAPSPVVALARMARSVASGMRFTPLGALTNSITPAVRQFGPRELFFFEKAIVLTPAAIEDALRYASTANGRPPGIIDVSYVDTNHLAGRYTLHIQVERIP